MIGKVPQPDGMRDGNDRLRRPGTLLFVPEGAAQLVEQRFKDVTGE